MKEGNLNLHNTNQTEQTDDCLYLHMVIPSGEKEKVRNKKEIVKKDVFYEVGCKIFEINKIVR